MLHLLPNLATLRLVMVADITTAASWLSDGECVDDDYDCNDDYDDDDDGDNCNDYDDDDAYRHFSILRVCV